MKIILHHNNYIIEIFDDPEYSQRAHSPTTYDKIYEPEADKDFASTSQHAIVVYDGERQIASAILLSSMGATTIHDDSAVIAHNDLIIRCSNFIYSLTLPGLRLNWMTRADPFICFSIHPCQEDYITHGELSIARIGRFGNIVWTYGGNDIFLKLEGNECFRMKENSIFLQDFSGITYEIDYNGNTLHSSTPPPPPPKKPWYKFW